MTYAPVRHRVAAGARLMDHIDPEWFEWVDIDALDMADPHSCISGQEFEDAGPLCWSGFDALVRSFGETRWEGDSVRQFGFNTASAFDSQEYGLLRRAWIDEIRLREAIRDGDVEVIR